MIKQVWINLPVKDVGISKEFFSRLGFSLNQQYGNSDQSASFLIGEKNIVLMLFKEATFKSFTRNELSDTSQTTEVLFSIDAESKEEVDNIAEKVKAAGGKVFAEPEESQGWMYGCGFADPDGHRWNVLYMDFSKLPAGK